MSRSAPPDGTSLHLLKPAQISRSPRDLLPLAQTSSDQLSLAQIHSDSSAASRKHVNYYYEEVHKLVEIRRNLKTLLEFDATDVETISSYRIVM